MGRATGSPFARNQETHKPEQNPGHLSRSAFRSASLRFTTTTTTTTYGHRVPTELCPTGPVVFCGGASHSLPLFMCNMITHRRWCSVSSKANGFGSEPKPNRGSSVFLEDPNDPNPRFQCFPRGPEGPEPAVPRPFFRVQYPQVAWGVVPPTRASPWRFRRE